MKKRIIALALLAALALTVFAACGKQNDVITSEEAQKLAIASLDVSESEVTDAHAHVTTVDGVPGYSIHITCGEEEYSVFVDAVTGEVTQ